MAQPTRYSRSYSFTGHQAANPSDPLPALRVDAEFDAVTTTTDQTRANLGLIQRDDGKLRNATVHPDAFDGASLLLMGSKSWTPRGEWATATIYAMGDMVESGGGTYVSMLAHLSGDFATDRAAGKWLAVREGSAQGDRAAFAPVRVATTENITLSGLQTIDGVLVGPGDRVLVKSQTTASANGIFVASAGGWARAVDLDETADFVAGATVRANEGLVNGGRTYALEVPVSVSVGSTEINWQPVSTTADVATLADLRVFAGGASDLVVRGASEPLDGGGGAYYADGEDDSSPDDGWAVIVSDNGTRWKRADGAVATSDSVDAFMASSPLPVGAIVRTGAEGFTYEVTDSETPDVDSDIDFPAPAIVRPFGGVLYFEQFGAGPTKSASLNAARMQRAIDALADKGGGTLKMGTTEGIWRFDSDLMITAPHITIDCQGARIHSNWRFTFQGNPDGLDGSLEPDDESLLLEDVHFLNANFGDPDDFDAICRGPIMLWVKDSSVRNVHKRSRGGTSFNLHFARRCVFENIVNYGAREIGLGGTIGILLYHTYDSEVRNCIVEGPGEWAYAMQQKGGYRNRWINPIVRNIEYANPTGMCLRDRGDDPYTGISPSTGPYPYLTKAWDQPDVRRASNETEWINPFVSNCPDTMPGLAVIQSRGTRIVSPRLENCRGIILYKNLPATGDYVDYDDHYEIVDYRGKDVCFPLLVRGNETEPLRHVNIRGVTLDGVKSTALGTQRDLYFERVEGGVVSGVTVEGSDSVSESLIYLDRCPGMTFSDLKASGTYTGAPVALWTSPRPVFKDCDMTAVTGVNAAKFAPGQMTAMRNTTAAAFTTTDATPNNICRAALPDDTTAYLIAEFEAKGPAGTYLYLRIGRGFQTTGSSLAALGASDDELERREVGPVTAWTGAFSVASNQVRMNATGESATTINWTVRYSWARL